MKKDAPNVTRAAMLSAKSSKQKCPKCGKHIGVLAGSLDAICKNCGYKDPCCE